jgi:hypothetical protein
VLQQWAGAMKTISVDVEVSLDEWSDSEIEEEFESRGLESRSLEMSETEFIVKARMLIRSGDKDGLFAFVGDYIRDHMGTAIV